MSFGLTNAPASFQHFINDTLRQHLDDFITAYLDDVLIYSNILVEHKIHVRKTLKLLNTHSLHLKFEKCEFFKTKVEYLEFVILDRDISINPVKIRAIHK